MEGVVRDFGVEVIGFPVGGALFIWVYLGGAPHLSKREEGFNSLSEDLFVTDSPPLDVLESNAELFKESGLCGFLFYTGDGSQDLDGLFFF